MAMKMTHISKTLLSIVCTLWGMSAMEPDAMKRVFKDNMAEQIDHKLRELGFSYVSLDLRGYRMGSMNAGIEELRQVISRSESLML